MPTNIQITGDPLNPDGYDLIAQIATLSVDLPIPPGWRVTTGGHRFSEIVRIEYREIIEEEEAVE